MKYPDFFNQIPSIQVKDSLADFLGAFEDGLVEYSYLDAVKLAGHSCPTIAGAYLLTFKALEILYPNEMPQRGGIKVEFKDSITDGVTGVIANVISQITGAAKESGFKGIGGKYVRHSLLEFNVNIQGMVRFIRVDNGNAVQLNYNPVVPPDASQQELMQKIVGNKSSVAENKVFQEMWQDRVRKILIDHFNDPNVIVRL